MAFELPIQTTDYTGWFFYLNYFNDLLDNYVFKKTTTGSPHVIIYDGNVITMKYESGMDMKIFTEYKYSRSHK